MNFRSFWFLIFAFFFPVALSGCGEKDIDINIGDFIATLTGGNATATTGNSTAIADSSSSSDSSADASAGSSSNSNSSSNANSGGSSTEEPPDDGTGEEPVVTMLCDDLAPGQFVDCIRTRIAAREFVEYELPERQAGLYQVAGYRHDDRDESGETFSFSHFVKLTIPVGFTAQFEEAYGYEETDDGLLDYFTVRVDGEWYECDTDHVCTRFDEEKLDASTEAEVRFQLQEAFDVFRYARSSFVVKYNDQTFIQSNNPSIFEQEDSDEKG